MGFLTFMITLIATSPASAKEAIVLNEKEVVRLSQELNPQRLNYEAQLKSVEAQMNQFNDNYSTHLNASATHQDSDEKAIATFIPTFGPTYTYSLGLQRRFKRGAQVEVTTFTNQQTTADGSINEATRTAVNVKATFDLYKNVLGKVDLNQYRNLKLQKKKAELEKNMNQRSFELSMRKAYWSLIANSESIKISEKLYKTSLQQLKQAKSRRRAAVADRGEVARYQAQASSRKSSITLLEYQKELIIQDLKNQFPQLHGKDVQLSEYNLDQTILEVLQCTEVIENQTKVPWDQTPLDDIVKTLEEIRKNERKVTDSYDDIDVQLNTELQISGVDQGYSDSYDDFTSNGEVGYEVGLQVSIPLGKKKKSSREVQEEFQQKRFLAEKTRLLNQLRSQHEQISPLIKLLRNSVKSQKENSQSLETSLKVMQRKYRQARVDVTSLINDQDLLLQSLLSEVDIKLTVIHTILDYFMIYSESPCKMNKI